eukprot:2363355-Prymnesium_polylepis.1
MLLSIDEISDKTADGQQPKLEAALAAAAEAWAEADKLGLLPAADGALPPEEGEEGAAAGAAAGAADDAAAGAADGTTDGAAQQPTDEGTQPPTDARAFFEQRRAVLRAKLHAKIHSLKA